MKTIRTIIIFLILGLITLLVFKGCSYLDLKVSEKYETQLEGVTNSPKELANAKNREIEIENEKKSILTTSIVSGIMILLFVFALIKINSSKHKENIN